MMSAGITLMVLSMYASVAGGVIFGRSRDDTGPSGVFAGIFTLTGAGIDLAVGVPLFAVGVSSRAVDSPRALGDVPERRSTPAMIAGLLLTGLGASSFAVGICGLASCSPPPGPDPFLMGIAGLTGALVFTAVGVPLAVYGGLPPDPESLAAVLRSPAIPSVGLGAGSATLRWRF
jgi:hypothetical protein